MTCESSPIATKWLSGLAEPFVAEAVTYTRAHTELNFAGEIVGKGWRKALGKREFTASPRGIGTRVGAGSDYQRILRRYLVASSNGRFPSL
jgi:hypothetical protein